MHERFWSKVNKNGPVHPLLGSRCWLWTGATTSRTKTGGYGSYYHEGKIVRAHVFSLSMKLERPVTGWALHRCDQSLCVNPDHLYEGSRDDNTSDAMSRGHVSSGENNARAKLTENDVVDLRQRRAAGESYSSLAEAFGISPVQASKIARGLRWPRAGGPIESNEEST